MFGRQLVPAKFLKLYDRAMLGKSAKAAIKAHCLMCCGWSRKAVIGCTAPGCPLYPLRSRYFRVGIPQTAQKDAAQVVVLTQKGPPKEGDKAGT